MRIFYKHVLNIYFELLNSLSGWRLFLFYALHYTVLFALLWHIIFFDFYYNGKSFLWYQDGVILWCTELLHLSNELQQAVTDFLAGNGWNYPPYSFSRGPIETDLRIEPLQLLSFFWQRDRIVDLYNILVVARYYLAGLSFSIFGFYFRQKPMPVLIGAVSYIFCHYALFACVRHPFYMQAMIYLPLLIVCTEEVLCKHKPYLLSAIVFIALSSNIYFACMLAIVTALYAFVRFPFLYRENRLRNFISIFIRLIVSVGIGTLLSGVFLVAPLLQNLRTGRVGNEIMLEYTSPFWYGKSYYYNFIARFIVVAGGGAGYWTFLGFSVLAVPAIAVLFGERKKEHGTLRIMFIVLTLMLMFPIAAYVMSGFNAISNRWCFAYSFCVSAIIMFEIPRIANGGKYTLACMGAGTIIYYFMCYFISGSSRYAEAGIVLLFISVGLILLCHYVGNKGKNIILPLCLVITCFSVCYTAHITYNLNKGKYVSRFWTAEQYYNALLNSPYTSFAKSGFIEKDKSFYRVAHNYRGLSLINSAVYSNVNGTTGNGEFYPLAYEKWLKELEVAQPLYMACFAGLDGRTALLALDAVKYYVLRCGEPNILPFSYTKVAEVKNENITDEIFKHRFALPIGYTYDKFYSRKEYESLNAVNKQELQLQAAVLEQKPCSPNINKAEPRFTDIQIPVSIVKANGVTWKDGVLNVKKNNASLTLAFKGLKDAETYVRLVNLDVTNGSSTRYCIINIKASNVLVTTQFHPDAYLYNHGMKTQLVNLGYTKNGYTACTITFPYKGTFILDDLQVWCQPMDHFGTQIEALRAEPLENVKTNPRGLTGTISLSKDKILCVSLPYTDGWTAYVDGKKAEIIQVNTAFMGMELTAGKHTIEFTYSTPGTNAGIVLSILGVFSLVGVIVYYKRKANKGYSV